MANVDVSSRLFREIFLASFMAGLPPENVKWAAAKLAPNMTDVRLKAGDLLYRQGELSDAHYFVVSGAIRLEAEGYAAWVLGPLSLVGTIDITMQRPRLRNAIAERDSFLFRMPAADWLDMLEDNFELMLRAVQNLGEGVSSLRVELDPFTWVPDGVAAVQEVTIPDGPLGFVDRLLLLHALPSFATAGMQALTNLAELAREETHDAGVELVTPGHASDTLWVILDGEAQATNDKTTHTETFGPATLVFGSSAATSRDLGYVVTTMTQTRTLSISREDFYDVMEEHFSLGRSVMKSLVGEREALLDEKERRSATAPKAPSRKA